MPDNPDLLVEIGTEELPPKSLRRLSEAFAHEVSGRLRTQGLEVGEATAYATPRRISVLVSDVPPAAPDREAERRGPSIDTAFDADGKPTKAALGFAGSCGVEVDHLERLETEAGSWLVFRSVEVGEAVSSIVPAVVEATLRRLPIARRMRWGDLDAEFVRPVHWVVMLHGEETIEAELLGVSAGRMTRGHRYHHPDAIPLDNATSYATVLYGTGHVIPDLGARRDMIREQVEEAGRSVGGHAVIDDALLEENTALVEWPSALVGHFDEEFLTLPDSVLSATMTGHQRYFPVADGDGRLMPCFVAVSNIESRRPETVRAGNERVLRPRLKDAVYFFETDLETSLSDRQEALKEVVFHEKLGSMHDKAQRVAKLAGVVAIALGGSPEDVKLARRAGQLSKCDLLTRMVGEFPELQGLMGAEYAARSGEPEAVAAALGEAYLPRFAGDAIPRSTIGRAVALADKLDTLTGVFAIGDAPTGDKDPYALRRAALGALRIIIEGELPIDLPRLLASSAESYAGLVDTTGVTDAVFEFTVERLRGYFAEQGVPVEVFQAVQAKNPTRPLDFARRAHAVNEFRKLPEAQSLAAANKRIQNILRRAEDPVPPSTDDSLFTEDAEWNLAAKLVGLGPRVRDMLKKGDYAGALTALAGLRETVDDFFDTVKVMDDDERVRRNRLALLNNVGGLFLETADVSKLPS